VSGDPPPRVAILTYSTRPRGGPVHALRLSEELHRLGFPVRLFALGDPDVGFFRRTRVPHTIFPAPPPAATLEERVFAAADAMASGLRAVAPGFAIAHAEDCITARAALRLREEGTPWLVLRTVHHVDDFSSRVLIECQERSILGPDARLVVSEHWRRHLDDAYRVGARVVSNGVDLERFRVVRGRATDELRARVRARDRFLFLTVGGVEPRKGTRELIEALAQVRTLTEPAPVLAIVGGASFQDYAEYRRAAFARAEELGIRMGRDLVMVGAVDDAEIPLWYAAADAFAFPSIKEGFGLAILEALAASLPVVTSDLDVFGEYLTHERNALMVPAGDAHALAEAMVRLIRDDGLRARLAKAGPGVAARFSWARSALEHVRIYRELAGGRARAGTG
jgi:glycosyltransferase-like protein